MSLLKLSKIVKFDNAQSLELFARSYAGICASICTQRVILELLKLEMWHVCLLPTLLQLVTRSLSNVTSDTVAVYRLL